MTEPPPPHLLRRRDEGQVGDTRGGPFAARNLLFPRAGFHPLRVGEGLYKEAKIRFCRFLREAGPRAGVLDQTPSPGEFVDFSRELFLFRVGAVPGSLLGGSIIHRGLDKACPRTVVLSHSPVAWWFLWAPLREPWTSPGSRGGSGLSATRALLKADTAWKLTIFPGLAVALTLG